VLNVEGSRVHADDEVSLYELLQVLLKGKRWLLWSVLFAVFVAGLYVFFRKKNYRSSVTFFPVVDVKRIASLNFSETKLPVWDAEKLLKFFLDELKKSSVLLDFMKKEGILKYYIKEINPTKDAKWGLVRSFVADNLVFKKNMKNQRKNSDIFDLMEDLSTVTIQLFAPGEQLSKKWLDGYLQHYIQHTKRQILLNLVSQRDLIIEDLKTSLESERSLSTLKRKSRIIQLKEAYLVAEKIGIIEQLSAPGGGLLRIESAQASPYFLGTKVLNAEIDSLNNRSSDDFFNFKVKILENKIKFLQGIELPKTEQFDVILINAPVLRGQSMVVGVRIILAISVLVGLTLGSMIIFTLEAFRKARQNKEGGNV